MSSAFLLVNVVDTAEILAYFVLTVKVEQRAQMWYSNGMKIGRAEFDIKKLTRYIGKFITHPILFAVRFLSYFMPRSKNIWVLGHPTKFDGNSKYLFLFLQNTKPKDIEAVWISRSKTIVRELLSHGYRAEYYFSLAGVWHCLRAKYFIVDTSVEVISYWLSGGVKVVNLFHALPIKKMEQDVTRGDSTEVILFHSKGLVKFIMRFLFPWRFVKPAFVPSSSPLYTGVFSSMFRLGKERIKETGIPRNDVLFSEISGMELGLDENAFGKVREAKSRGMKVAIYAPTFRDTGDQHSFLEEPEALQKLNALMQSLNALFLVKIHPFMRIKVPQEDYQNIFFANPNTDSYPLLKLADILVTDYSSIFVDFLLLNRPEIFFPYDYEKYVTKDRELYFDYNEFTPGPKARVFSEFLGVLGKTLQGEDDFAQKRITQRDRCFSKIDSNASRRTIDEIRNI
ncbi:MAG: hypothetical protein A2842_01000 [Candidatus Wildermuthbacteria bacterium RIFCSPHIGHO2_01_FULL_48_25]|uniref:Uncharacterized protein n=1 Tax=Candidatus Wildermuthbacteria bacterium RIFCSPLOWO2_01_FULL_48_16 TaxID=1802461 RepID=A0A1G2RNJ7_9BACT|nr:MAG: hypothetical protein A2842_01000 [Candidatus Wildermuthbacteria bacterium RIFCSPHIGHO2_01_FULL_48_25]OHA73591.1 MAG: hypothetical protein A3B24_00165 [Candidatus Wildermuthbacteria bacterium RIFCSPLOWO2_01_FULL_48_16]